MNNILAKFKLPEVEEHIPQLAKIQNEREQPNESFQEFMSVLDSLIQNYNKRLRDFLNLTFQPHLVDIFTAPANFQTELIELSEDNIIKSLFNSKDDLLEIWKSTTD